MTRPITLFTGQWADLPFPEMCRLASEWGYDGLEVELWEHPRSALQRLLLTERFAILGRLPPEPPDSEAPQVCARVARRGSSALQGPS